MRFSSHPPHAPAGDSQGLEALARYMMRSPVSLSRLRFTPGSPDIDVLLASDYPGDGREKPVRFPDPVECALRGKAFSLVPLEKLIELKLASGMTAPHRLKDLADVIELIRVNSLTADFGQTLDPYVREKYRELWRAAQGSDVER